MSDWRLTVAAGILALTAGSAITAEAQPKLRTINVGRIASQKTCKLYQESSGRSAVVATPYGVAAAESWKTWLVRDCVDNFASIRTSLEAALASSGKFAIRPKGAGYTVSGVISQVGLDGDDGPAPNPGPEGFSVSRNGIFVNMDVTVRDAAGRIVYGGLLTKHMETGSRSITSNLYASSNQSGEGVYTELQHQVALAVARLVAFHIDPLVVTEGQGREIRLNYGSPLLTLGTIVHVNGRNGATVRYTVTSADPIGATAEIDSEADSSQVGPGSGATVVESDDAAANERRTQRVDLPG